MFCHAGNHSISREMPQWGEYPFPPAKISSRPHKPSFSASSLTWKDFHPKRPNPVRQNAQLTNSPKRLRVVAMKKLFIAGSAIIALTLFVNSRSANHIQASSIACGGCTNNVLACGDGTNNVLACGGCTNNVLACGGDTNSTFNALLALQ